MQLVSTNNGGVMNNLTICGRLGRDPETKTTKSGSDYTRLTLCAQLGKEKALWWSVLCFGSQNTPIIKYLSKGSAIIVTGRMSEPSVYSASDGELRVSLSMICDSISFCPTASRAEHAKDEPQQQEDVIIEEIPF